MKNLVKSCSFAAMLFIVLLASCTQAPEITLDGSGFKNPPQNAKIHTWWHWMDGSITQDGITKDLEAMKEQGIVQATILNVGLFNDRDFGVPKARFASDNWFGMFQWALSEAKRLQITIGVHNCDGWSSTGGPWITPEMSMKQYVWTKQLVKGGQTIATELKKPYAVLNFYKDVAVVAYKIDEPANAFQQLAPKLTLNNSEDASYLYDGNPVSGLTIKRGHFIDISSDDVMDFDKIMVHLRRSFMWGNTENFKTSLSVHTSNDGKKFTKLGDFSIDGLNKNQQITLPPTSAKFVRVKIDDYSYIDDYIPLNISELELLKGNEKPFYAPVIQHISEKTVSTKPSSEQSFYSRGNDPSAKAISGDMEMVLLTDKMDANGNLKWEAPEGNWAILRFGYTTTAATNAPGTPEGTGLECDKMDTLAANLHFNNFPAKLIEKAGEHVGNTFKFVLIDSWECGYQNWTANFPDEFKKRRGYDLLSYLPVLCGEIVGSEAESEAVLFDFRKTIAELIQQNYYEHFSKLYHKHKLEFHSEVIYGNDNYPPLDILKSTECVDLPMYEYWTNTTPENLIQYHPTATPELNLPACAAIGYGKQVIAAESYTGMAHYSESPSELKPFGDRAYCSGINQFILHSYVHQPTDQKPGMTLGSFASHFNRNNLYWPYISEWSKYQARIQYILQQGVTTSDVLYYLGDQLPQYFVSNQSTLLPFGYQVNACNFDILKNRIEIKDDKLRLNKSVNYSLLSLPAHPFMNFETLKRIETLVKNGAKVYGPKPIYTLTKTDLADNQEVFKQLADEIWGKEDGRKIIENNYGKGKVFWGMPIGDVLDEIGLKPDFSTNIEGENNFHFIHKKVGDTDVYFVANQQNRALTGDFLFRISGKSPEIWNPEDGSMIRPANIRDENGLTRISASFALHESKLFVFKPGKANDSSKLSGEFIPDEEAVIADISGSIVFEPAYSAAIPAENIHSLQSFTAFTNPDIRYFSGNAHYKLKFKAPESFVSANDSILLDIGNFESVARVSLNGKLLGDLWKPGTKLNVSKLVKAENELEITVTNLFRNRLIGDYVQFGKIQSIWTSSPIEQFLNKDKALKPSGLMGPIKLFRGKNI